MKIQNALGFLLKLFTLIAVVGIIILAISVYFYSFYEITNVIQIILFEQPEEGEIILKSLKAIDMVLIGVVFFIIGIGLFELFISPVDNLPEWFQIKNIDQLKAKLVKVIVLVMGVSFTGRIVTWDGQTDLLGYGVSLGIVIFALSYFLKVKLIKERKEVDDI